MVELMVTLVVLAIIVTMGVPSFRSLVESNRLTTATNALVASLNQARAEAVKYSGRVTICKGEVADTDCDDTKEWHQGWIVYRDNNVSSTTAPAINSGSDTIIRRGGQGLNGNIVIEASGGADYVSFTGDGRSKNLAGGTRTVTFRVCSSSSVLDDARRARDITVSASGAISSETPASVAADCPAP